MKKLLIVLCFCLSSLWAGKTSPLELIKTKDIELQKKLKENKAKPSAKIKEDLKVLINSIFDFKKMGEKALPSSVWKGLEPAKQEEFVTNFKMMVENSSVKKLEVYESDSTVYDKPEVKTKKAKVTAHVWSKNKESILVYKLHNVEGQWKAWDLVIDDLSTVRNYREKFKKELKTKSFDELLQLVKDKANEK